MPLNPSELTIIREAEEVISLESHPAWVRLREWLTQRAALIEESINKQFEQHTPNRDYVYLLTLQKLERQAVVTEVLNWIESCKLSRDKIIRDVQEYDKENNSDYLQGNGVGSSSENQG